jgi:hypothetical protein
MCGTSTRLDEVDDAAPSSHACTSVAPLADLYGTRARRCTELAPARRPHAARRKLLTSGHMHVACSWRSALRPRLASRTSLAPGEVQRTPVRRASIARTGELHGLTGLRVVLHGANRPNALSPAILPSVDSRAGCLDTLGDPAGGSLAAPCAGNVCSIPAVELRRVIPDELPTCDSTTIYHTRSPSNR